jgi:hypothetical protein
MEGLAIWQERQKTELEHARRERFLSVLALDGKLPINSGDVEFASSLTRNELYTLAIAASARYRATSESNQ